MSDEQAQQLLHDAGDQVTVGAPPTTALIRAGRRAKRRRRLVGVAGTAAVTALVIGVAAALVDQGDVRGPVADPPVTTGGTPDGLTTAPGTRLVGTKGFAVAVPEEWSTNEARCGDSPFADTVVFGLRDFFRCLLENTQFSALHIDGINGRTQNWANAAKPWQTVNGVTIERVPTHTPGCLADLESCVLSTGALVIKRAQLVMWVESPDAQVVDEILDSVRPIPDGYTAIPDVSNEYEAAARRQLEAADLSAGHVELSGCRSVRRCAVSRVIDLDPPAGTAVPVGTGVRLEMTSGVYGWPISPSAELLAGRRLAVTTHGSGTCPELVESTAAAEGNRVIVSLKVLGPGDCTDDSVPHTSISALPAGIDTSQQVLVTFARGGEGFETIAVDPG